MFYVRLFGVIFILIAPFFNALFLVLFTSGETPFDVTLILSIVGLVIAFIALLISKHEENNAIKKKFGTGTITTMQKNAYLTSDEGKKWNERIQTIFLLGGLWFFSSFAMIFVAMALQKKFELY